MDEHVDVAEAHGVFVEDQSWPFGGESDDVLGFDGSHFCCDLVFYVRCFVSVNLGEFLECWDLLRVVGW